MKKIKARRISNREQEDNETFKLGYIYALIQIEDTIKAIIKRDKKLEVSAFQVALKDLISVNINNFKRNAFAIPLELKHYKKEGKNVK